MAKRRRLSWIGLAVCSAACGLVLVCCTRPSAPRVSVTSQQADNATAAAGRDAAQVAPPRQSDSQPPAQPPPQPPAPPAPTIEIEQPEPPTPPPYLSIVERIDAGRRPRIDVRLDPPQTLELDTDNVRRLRLTREGLPLSRTHSIVLRVDGQGIEWTPKYVAIELERSPAGAWEVVGRRAYAP